MICPGKTGSANNYIMRKDAARRTNNVNRRQKGSKARRGISPVISSTIIIAITVVLGLSLWSFVTSQVNTSTQSFASATSDYVNYVNERYVIVNMAFEYDDPNNKGCDDDTQCVTIWIHNFSERDVRIKGILFGDAATSQQTVMECTQDNKTECPLLKANTLGSVSVDLSDLSDSINFKGDGKMTYYATVTTDGGATQVYYQTDK